MSDDRGKTAEERARQRVEERTGLVIHGVVFALVNSFLWIQDLLAGGGIDWAYWTTIPWGIGLAIHGAVYGLDNGRRNDHLYERYLAEERARDAEREHQPQ